MEELRQSPVRLCADSPTLGLAQALTSLHARTPKSSVAWSLQQAAALALGLHLPLHLPPARPRSPTSTFQSGSLFLPFIPLTLTHIPGFIFFLALATIYKYFVNFVTVACHPHSPECRAVHSGGPSVQGSPWHQGASTK